MDVVPDRVEAWWTRRAAAEAWEVAREADWARLDRELREVARARSALDAREAALLREAEEQQLWRAFGYASLLEYVERAMGYAPHTARERIRVAKALEALPQLAEALERGALRHSAVRELTRVASSGTEGEWLEAANGKTLREIEALVAGKPIGSRPDDPSQPNLRKHRLVLELSPEIYDLIRHGAARLAEIHGHRLSHEEAIAAAFRMALEDRDGTSAPSRPGYQLAIKTCPDCHRSWEYSGGRDLEVGAHVVAQARCDADELGDLDAAEPARRTTTVTARIRAQVFARDGYACQVPGCRRITGLDLHHIQFQEHGGGHELSNLVLICNLHHAAVHRGKLEITGRAPRGVSFAFPRGHATDGFEDEEWLDDAVVPSMAVDPSHTARAFAAHAMPSAEARSAVPEPRPHESVPARQSGPRQANPEAAGRGGPRAASHVVARRGAQDRAGGEEGARLVEPALRGIEAGVAGVDERECRALEREVEVGVADDGALPRRGE